MKIKKGDNVIVIAGKDRGKKGKVLRALPREAKVVVEGVHMRKKHVKPKRSDQKGQIIEMPAPFFAASVQMVCAKCGKPTRIGYAGTAQKKSRVCKKCGADL